MSADCRKSSPNFDNFLDKLTPQLLRKLDSVNPIWIALRTYALSLSLSLGPAIIPVLTTEGGSKGRNKLISTIRKELGVSGFAFAMTVAVGGGAAVEHYWRQSTREDGEPVSQRSPFRKFSILYNIILQRIEINPIYRTFICNLLTSSIAILLLQSRRRSSQTAKANLPLTIPITPPERLSDKRTSATLDLSLLLLVRALDSIVQSLFLRHAEKVAHVDQPKMGGLEPPVVKRIIRKKAMTFAEKLDALVFWIASARIMWCFFYRPERLPRSYVKWIGALANVDGRLLEALRKRRDGTWTYGGSEYHFLLSPMAEGLGYPRSWGDTLKIPPYGGKAADKAWNLIGVKGRNGVGGIPCEIVHGGIGSSIIPGGVGGSCFANLIARGGMGFFEALAIYAPVHFLPAILSRPYTLLAFPTLKNHFLALLRSSLFLSTFISSIWAAVCFTRTLVVARLFPRLSHNFIDGPFGCAFVGCLMCGGSIWIEKGKRRGEIALYVLPRALRSLLKKSWVKNGSKSFKIIERLVFVLSLASILTASEHHPESLRGLSRWTGMFVTKGVQRGSRNGHA